MQEALTRCSGRYKKRTLASCPLALFARTHHEIFELVYRTPVRMALGRLRRLAAVLERGQEENGAVVDERSGKPRQVEQQRGLPRALPVQQSEPGEPGSTPRTARGLFLDQKTLSSGKGGCFGSSPVLLACSFYRASGGCLGSRPARVLLRRRTPLTQNLLSLGPGRALRHQEEETQSTGWPDPTQKQHEPPAERGKGQESQACHERASCRARRPSQLHEDAGAVPALGRRWEGWRGICLASVSSESWPRCSFLSHSRGSPLAAQRQHHGRTPERGASQGARRQQCWKGRRDGAQAGRDDQACGRQTGHPGAAQAVR